jgi:hypothetical protein
MRWDERDTPRRAEPRGYRRGPVNDYGQADYDTDYGYDAAARTGFRAEEPFPDRNDFGQADYSHTYSYDPANRTGYRTEPPAPDYDPRVEDDGRRAHPRWNEPRTWFEGRQRNRERNDKDRALWGAVTGRLAYDRRLDASDIHVTVEDGVVLLEGVVRNRSDRERAEDLAEVKGARYVRNNLHVRERRGWF